MSISNKDLHERLKKMMGQGSPLQTVLEEQKPKKPKKTKNPKVKRNTRPNRKRQYEPVYSSSHPNHPDYVDDDGIRNRFMFIFNHRPYEATKRHNTVNLLDLTTYQSNISHTLWEDEEVQHLHEYLQRNWELLEVHKEDDAETTTFLIDALFDIVPQ